MPDIVVVCMSPRIRWLCCSLCPKHFMRHSYQELIHSMTYSFISAKVICEHALHWPTPLLAFRCYSISSFIVACSFLPRPHRRRGGQAEERESTHTRGRNTARGFSGSSDAERAGAHCLHAVCVLIHACSRPLLSLPSTPRVRQARLLQPLRLPARCTRQTPHVRPAAVKLSAHPVYAKRIAGAARCSLSRCSLTLRSLLLVPLVLSDQLCSFCLRSATSSV